MRPAPTLVNTFLHSRLAIRSTESSARPSLRSYRPMRAAPRAPRAGAGVPRHTRARRRCTHSCTCVIAQRGCAAHQAWTHAWDPRCCTDRLSSPPPRQARPRAGAPFRRNPLSHRQAPCRLVLLALNTSRHAGVGSRSAVRGAARRGARANSGCRPARASRHCCCIPAALDPRLSLAGGVSTTVTHRPVIWAPDSWLGPGPC